MCSIHVNEIYFHVLKLDHENNKNFAAIFDLGVCSCVAFHLSQDGKSEAALTPVQPSTSACPPRRLN